MEAKHLILDKEKRVIVAKSRFPYKKPKRSLRTIRRIGMRVRENPKDRLGICGLPAETQVRVVADKGGANFHGVLSCGCVHICPVCASQIQAERTKEIAQVIGAPGRYSIYMTLTLNHTRGDDLRTLIKSLNASWARIRRGTFGRRSKKYGEIGYVKTLDHTWSKKSGHHPHLAILVVFPEKLPEEQLIELKELAFKNWKQSLELEDRIANEGGFYFDTATNPGATSAYLAKINKLAWEVGSNINKTGKTGDHLSPWEILELADTSPYFVKIWREYCRGIKGFKSIQHSKNWKDLIPEPEEEKEDYEEPEPLFLIRASLYRHILKIQDDDRVLEVCDRALEGDSGAQMLLKGMKRVSLLFPVNTYEHKSYDVGYEEKIWKPLHNQLSMFCD